MGKLKEGILGAFSGKVGTVVGVQNGDSFYMRSLPRKRTSFTDKELLNQAKFKLIQDYLKPVQELLTVGFKGYFTKTGGYRAAIAYTRRHALVADDAGFYIDPALFKISGGDLEQALNPILNHPEQGVLQFSWDTTQNIGLAADQLLALVYDPIAKEGVSVVYDGALRKSGNFSLQLPLDFSNREVDIYMGFMAADRSRQSDSQYLGRIKLI